MQRSSCLCARAIALVLASLALGGCIQRTKQDDIKLSPGRQPLLEAVPIWVSSSAITSGGSTPVWVDLNTTATIDEPIEIQPFILPSGSAPRSPNVQDLIDFSKSDLKFDITAGRQLGQTQITTVAQPAGFTGQIVYLIVRDNKGSSTVYGSLLILP